MHIAVVFPITVPQVWGMFSLDLLGMSNFQPLGKNQSRENAQQTYYQNKPKSDKGIINP
jgi:hypothetical protein